MHLKARTDYTGEHQRILQCITAVPPKNITVSRSQCCKSACVHVFFCFFFFFFSEGMFESLQGRHTDLGVLTLFYFSPVWKPQGEKICNGKPDSF